MLGTKISALEIQNEKLLFRVTADLKLDQIISHLYLA